jgi:5-formyltetrahydrofolate cyclo-ligase
VIQPSRSATKSEWRAWAKTLDPFATGVVPAVHAAVGPLVAAVAGPVLGYVALDDELTCPPGATALPRLDDGGSMTLHAADAELEVHRHGFAQPRSDAPEIDLQHLAAVLVPGRVFDRSGYRLGRGGGHYDRLLPQISAAVPIIGVTCSARIVDALPREAHDRPMTHLATEDGIIELDS